MSKIPVLGFICPQCRHGMRSVCDVCEQADQIEAGVQEVLDTQVREEHLDTLRDGVKGFQEFEEFTNSWRLTFSLVHEVDEDDNSVWVAVAACPSFRARGEGASETEALRALRVAVKNEIGVWLLEIDELKEPLEVEGY